MADINVEKLAEKFSQISDILNGIKTQNALSIEGTTRSLSGISDKLAKIELLSEKDSSDLLKSLLEEIRKNLDDKYSLLSIKFSEVETSFRNLVRTAEDNLTQKEIKDLFDIVSTNISVFSKQVMSHGDLLNEINLRIEAMRMDASQNQDILKNLSQLRTDVEKFNNGFESIILNINSSFEKVSEDLKNTSVVDDISSIKKSFEDMQFTMQTVISSIQIFDKKNDALEAILNTIGTREDIEAAKEVMHNIILQNEKLAESIDNLASTTDYQGLIAQLDETKGLMSSSNERLLEDLSRLELVVSNILSEEDFEKFKKDFSKLIYEVIESTNVVRGDVLGTTSEIKNLITVMNSLDFKTIFNKVLNNLTNLESNIRTNIYEVTNKVSQEAENLNTRISGEFNPKFDLVNDNIMKIPGYTAEKLSTYLNEFANKLALIQEDVKAANALYSETFSDKYDVLADKINSTNITLDTISSIGISSLKFNIEDLSQKMDQSKEYISESTKYNYSDILDKIKTLSKGLELLDDKISKPNNEAIEVVLANVSELTRKVEEFNTNIEKVEFADNINRLKEILNFMPEIIKESIKKDFTTTIETDISSRIEELETLFSNITMEFSNTLTDFKNRVSDSIQVIKDNTETSDIKLNNTVFEINALKADIQRIHYEMSQAVENQSQKFIDVQDNTVNRIEEVLNSLSSLNVTATLPDGSQPVINVPAIESKLDKILEGLKSARVQDYSVVTSVDDANELSEDNYLRIEAKINKLKEQLSFTTTDLHENIQNSARTVLDNIAPLRDKLITFADDEYQDLMSDFKVQLEYFTNKLKTLFSEVEGTENSGLLNNLFAGLASLNSKMSSIEGALQSGALPSGGFAPVQAGVPVNSENVNKLSEALKTLSASSLVDLKNGMEAVNKKLDLLAAHEREVDFLSPEKGLEQLAKLNEVISVEKLNALNKLNLLDKLQTLSVLDNIDKIPQINTFLELQSQLKDIIIALDQKLNAFYKNMESIDRVSDDIRTSFETSKEDMLKGVLQIFEQISFVEEAEDIKDYLDENVVKNLSQLNETFAENFRELKSLKHVINSTNSLEYSEVEGDFQQIHTSLEQLKAEQLMPLQMGLASIKEQFNILKAGTSVDSDYSYTMQDIESDIAKLRLLLQDIQQNPKMDVITQNIEQLVNFLDGLKFDFTREDMGRFQADIAKMADELIDLSSRTNRLILVNEDSRTDIKNTVANFQMYLNSIYENIKPLSDMKLNTKIETIAATVDKMLKTQNDNGKTVNNVNEKIDVAENNITESIRELKKVMPQSASVITIIERKFEEQERRLASMEEKLNEFMEAFDAGADSEITKKMSNIEKQLNKLNKSIEKVTSYVDEE